MSRFELKYQLDDYGKTQFKALCQSEFGFFKKYEDRQVRSLYFDTADNEFVMGNLSGISQRSKFRLRWYTTDDEFCTNPRFEIKSRTNRTGNKYTFDAPSFDEKTSISKIKLNSDKILRREFLNVSAFNNKILMPKLQIKYRRSYYENLAGLRVTFDSDIFCANATMPQAIGQCHWSGFRYDLAEIKVDSSKLDEGLTFIQKLPYKNRRHSKYLMGLHLLGNATYI